MVCPTCYGTGSQYFESLGDFPSFSTQCYGCQGSGIVSCCDTAGAAHPLRVECGIVSMICPKCWNPGLAADGTLRKMMPNDPLPGVWADRYPQSGPCPECQGSGIVSCCDTAGAAHPLDELSRLGQEWDAAPFTRPEDYWHGIDDEA